MNRYFFECFVEQIYHFEALDNKLLKKLKPGKNAGLGEFGIFLHFFPCFCYNNKYNSGVRTIAPTFLYGTVLL